MGHAGAIISGSSGTAQGKKEALEARGVQVGTTPTEVAQLVADRMKYAVADRDPVTSRHGCHLVCARRSRARVPPGRGARRLRPRGDRGATAPRCSPTGPAAATRRCASGSPRATASSRRASSSRAARCRASSSSPSSSSSRDARARRGADVRPAAEDPRRASAPRSSALPMDDDGLQLDALERALADGEKPAFLYTIPTFQNPSGRTLSQERRRAPRRARTRARAARARGRPVRARALRGRAAADASSSSRAATNVAYASSFSKTIAPGVRVGYFVLPPALAAQIEALAVSTYISPPFMTQATVHEFLRRGNFEPNLERVSGLLQGAARRDARGARALHARRRDAGAGPTAATSSGSTCRTEAGDLLARAEAAGVTFVKGTDFFAGRRRHDVAAARVQLRLAGRDRRRRSRSSRGYFAVRRRRRLRSSCESRIPTTKPTARLSRISQTSETFAVANTKCRWTDFLFSSTNAIAYAASRMRAISRA